MIFPIDISGNYSYIEYLLIYKVITLYMSTYSDYRLLLDNDIDDRFMSIRLNNEQR